jgi:hypothetical protein
MADNIVGTKIVIDSSQAVESVSSIKKQLKEANLSLIEIRETFGETSKEAIQAAKKVAELKDRITSAKEATDLFDPGKRFQAITTAAGQVASAFAGIQGAMALAGVESEDLTKQLVKIQGAMALSQGLSELSDLGKSFEQLKITAVSTFNSIKTAIGASGIGLLVVALGSIVAYWDEIKSAISGVSEEQEKLNTKTQESVNAEKEKLDALGSQDNILKLQGKSEEDILKLKIKQTDQVIKSLEAQLQSQIAIENAQIKAAQRNKDILEGVLKFITAPITLLLRGIDMAGQAFGKTFGLEKGFYGGIAGAVFDPKDIKDKGDKANKELQKQILALQNTRAGYELSLKKSATGGKTTTEGGGKIDKIDLETIEGKQINAIERLGLAYKTLDAVRAESTLKNQDTTAMNIKLAQDEANARKAAYGEIGQALGILSNAADEGSELQKGLALAQIAIDTGLAISNLTATSSAPTPDNLATGGLSGFAKYAVGIAKILANLAAARNIIKGANRSGGGGTPTQTGMTAPVTPASQIQQTVTTLNQGTINALGNQAIKAYVLESDVTNSQNRVTRILNSSRFK